MNGLKRGKRRKRARPPTFFARMSCSRPRGGAILRRERPGLENVALKSRKASVRAAAMRALTFATFINTMNSHLALF